MFGLEARHLRMVVIHCKPMLVHGGGSRMSSRSRQKPLRSPEFSNLLVNIVLLLHVDGLCVGNETMKYLS